MKVVGEPGASCDRAQAGKESRNIAKQSRGTLRPSVLMVEHPVVSYAENCFSDVTLLFSSVSRVNEALGSGIVRNHLHAFFMPLRPYCHLYPC